MNWAITGGQLEVICWLINHGCFWDASLCNKAIKDGNVRMLEWAIDSGCPYDVDFICETAALPDAGGHLDIVKWARQRLYEWGEDTCLFATLGGHLSILQWAWADAPRDNDACLEAALKSESTLGVAIWILNNTDLGSFQQKYLVMAARSVAKHDEAACFEMLLESCRETLHLSELEAGVQCAWLAQKSSIPLTPQSKDRLDAAIERQVAAGVVLKHRMQLHRELTLDIFKMAGFFGVPHI